MYCWITCIRRASSKVERLNAGVKKNPVQRTGFFLSDFKLFQIGFFEFFLRIIQGDFQTFLSRLLFH